MPRFYSRRGIKAISIPARTDPAFEMSQPSPQPSRRPSGTPTPPKGGDPLTPRRQRTILIIQIAFAVMLFWLWARMGTGERVVEIPYSQFKTLLEEGKLKEVAISETEISGKATGAPPAPVERPPVVAEAPATKATPEGYIFRTARVEDPGLVNELQKAGVSFAGKQPGMLALLLGSWVMPLALLVLFWLWIGRSMRGSAGQAILGIGKSKARVMVDTDTGVSFADVAGCDEAKFELEEVVDFLKNPDRYLALGARIPRGALLVGPPGTGKTLLARAVAGEAKVPFFSLSGSEFVEMFVGVGAARVRDLFVQAKAQAPCIIFIDELDAIGRQRGVQMSAGGHDEREQTLNQLLVELDGFDPNAGIIILSATNRPEVLDRALLRPGRFDRQIVVDSPDLEGRAAILRVHSRGKPLNEDVNLLEIARGTPGFSGADLANTLNEAALLAARRRATSITQKDLEDALEKVIAGPERKSRRLNSDEKRRVAYHEAGHAVVAAHSENADPVRKISIIPRGRAALGYTMQLPTEQQFLMTREGILDRIRGLMGGRAAEELIFHEATTGAENDLERATAMARQMVCVYGMNDTAGLARTVQIDLSPFAQNDASLVRNCSEETAQIIDREVKQILDDCYNNAHRLLTRYRDELERVADELLRHETLDATAFYGLVSATPPPIAELPG